MENSEENMHVDTGNIKGLKALKKSHSFDPCFALGIFPHKKEVENETAPTCITKMP